MKTGTLGGMPGAPGVTALEPVGEEPPTLCAVASMEGKPHLTSNKTQFDSIFEIWKYFVAKI